MVKNSFRCQFFNAGTVGRKRTARNYGMTCCVLDKMKISLLIFLGSIVSMQHGIDHASGVTQLVLIDGQQRLTTLSLLLSALGRAIEAKNVDICIDRSSLERDYLFNDRREGELRYKQLLTRHDKDILIQLLEEGKVSDNTSLLATTIVFLRINSNTLTFKWCATEFKS